MSRAVHMTPRGLALGAALNGSTTVDAVIVDIIERRGHLHETEEQAIRAGYAELVTEGMIAADGSVPGASA